MQIIDEEDPEDLDVSLSNDEYPWAESKEERRRSFVFSTTGGELAIEAMEKIEQWLKSGRGVLRVVPTPKG